jgi:hypothetical protein
MAATVRALFSWGFIKALGALWLTSYVVDGREQVVTGKEGEASGEIPTGWHKLSAKWNGQFGCTALSAQAHFLG